MLPDVSRPLARPPSYGIPSGLPKAAGEHFGIGTLPTGKNCHDFPNRDSMIP
ncbi:hypothetical protein MMSP_1823 [Mycobacterium sp. 012931]|nr:hypothetical protein MMSP_1823 [Mycobacterium sp. 012931]MBC9865364.1 hypothetical protein [Mycobacterium pseudoshottsii]